MNVRLLFSFIVGWCVLLLAGCSGGGGGQEFIGNVAGFTQDFNGDPVRGADVFVSNGPSTLSNSSGAYRLVDVRGDRVLVKSTISQDGIDYYGENLADIFQSDTSKSVNITLVPVNSMATLRGTVRNRNGDLVGGAHVFAKSGETTSTIAVTNDSGRFEIRTIYGNRNYTVVASAANHDSDVANINIAPGGLRDIDMTLDDASNASIPPPSNVQAVAWTSPREVSRSVELANGIEGIKRLLDPKRPHKQTRDTSGGNFIEIDLTWDQINNTALLGFGIYRGNGDTNVLNQIDFYRDPQAVLYEDADPALQELSTYSYAMTSLNTRYPDTGNSESGFSNRVVARTLSDLTLDSPTFSPLTFRWFSGSGAGQYTVYLLSRYPGIDVIAGDIVWSKTTGSTSVVYDGPALNSGQRYWYFVDGTANGGNSHSISIIDTFVR